MKRKASVVVVRYAPVVALIEPLQAESERQHEQPSTVKGLGTQLVSKCCSGWCFVAVTRNLGWLEKRTYCSTTTGLVVLIRPSFAAAHGGLK